MPADSPRSIEGLLLRVVDYRDSDCIVTWLAETVGKGAGYARSARKSHKRFAGGLELFRWYRLEVQPPRRGGGLPTITAAEAQRDLRGIARSLEHISAASCALDCARVLLEDDVPCDEILGDLWRLLEALDATANESPELAILALRWFELALLGALGVAPELGRCVRSGRPLPRGAVPFSFGTGGTLHPDALEEGDFGQPLSPATRRGLMRLQETPLDEIVRGARERLERAGEAPLRAFTREAGRINLRMLEAGGRKLSSYDFLAKLRR